MQSMTLKTADGLDLHTIRWPVATPRARVVIVHGLGEHAARYTHVAAALNAADFSVYALDHRGHGRSSGTRTYFDSFGQPEADLARYIDEIRQTTPDVPLFIYGHSMGSLIALRYTLKHQGDLAGLIVSGYALSVKDTAPTLLFAVIRSLSTIIPKQRLLPLGYDRLISRDPVVQAAYRDDPLVDSGLLRVGMAAKLLAEAEDQRGQHQRLHLPILILHGSDDQITPASGGEILFEQVSSTDKTHTVYPAAYHELHNEPEQETVIADIVAWLKAHCEPVS